MAVVDVATFNGEYDLLEIRLNILSLYVDQFIIVEATTTFSGKPKELYYEKEKERFAKFADKIKYHVVRPEDEEKYMALAHGSPNTRGAEHWKKEFCQKECIKDALTHLNDDDLVFVGDCDEVWDSDFGLDFYNAPRKLELSVYTYFLNNKSSEKFWGTLVANYSYIKTACLNHLRSDSEKTNIDFSFGWHFTSMGGYEEVKRKLSDSYTRESYWTEVVEKDLPFNLEFNKDFLGRDFHYKTDESDWPQYLKDNKDKYKHLCKQ